MAITVFKLALVRANTHEPVVFEGGGVHERDFVEAIMVEVAKEQVGFFTTRADVLQAVQRSVEAALYAFKLTARP